MSGTDIFLSYARQDRPAARSFAEAFVEEGFSVWWDASLHSGETFDEVIEQRLRDAKAVVVLWSPSSVASRWVRSEATLADRRHKLVPAVIEECDRPIAFELTHTAELTKWAGDTSDLRWRNFVEDLHRLVQAGAERPPAQHEPAILASRTAPVASQPHAPAELHCLEAEDEELAAEPIVVDSSGVRIGRSAPADVVLSHRSVSREHCIVGLANDELLVTDLNSTNGTYIDGVRISRASILPVGSVLRVGEVALRHAVRAGGDNRRPHAERVAVS